MIRISTYTDEWFSNTDAGTPNCIALRAAFECLSNEFEILEYDFDSEQYVMSSLEELDPRPLVSADWVPEHFEITLEDGDRTVRFTASQGDPRCPHIDDREVRSRIEWFVRYSEELDDATEIVVTLSDADTLRATVGTKYDDTEIEWTSSKD